MIKVKRKPLKFKKKREKKKNIFSKKSKNFRVISNSFEPRKKSQARKIHVKIMKDLGKNSKKNLHNQNQNENDKSKSRSRK